MIKLVIAGSMDLPDQNMSQNMRIYLERLAEYTLSHPQSFIWYIGDNPKGVDMMAYAACRHFKLNYMIWGVGTPRFQVPPTQFISVAEASAFSGKQRWTARDQAMIRAADIGRFLSNGQLTRNGQPTGTRAGYEYMISLGKNAKWIDLSQPLPD